MKACPRGRHRPDRGCGIRCPGPNTGETYVQANRPHSSGHGPERAGRPRAGPGAAVGQGTRHPADRAARHGVAWRHRQADHPVWRRLSADHKALAERELAEDLAASGVSTEVVVVSGDPLARILETADAYGCSLIVTGTARDETLGRLLLGTTVEAGAPGPPARAGRQEPPAPALPRRARGHRLLGRLAAGCAPRCTWCPRRT